MPEMYDKEWRVSSYITEFDLITVTHAVRL